MDRQKTIYNAAGEIVEQTLVDYSWDFVKAERSRELSSTDWRALKDRTMPQVWKDYRQFLRDLPQNFTDANDACDAWRAYDIPE